MSDVLEETDVSEVTSKTKHPALSGERRGPLAWVVIAILLRMETTHKNYLLNVHFLKVLGNPFSESEKNAIPRVSNLEN